MTGVRTFVQARRLALRRRLALAVRGRFDPYPTPPVDTELSPSAAHAALAEAAPLRLAWRRAGITDAAAWQKKARAKLTELTFHRPADAVPKARFFAESELSGGLLRRHVYLRLGERREVPVDVIRDRAAPDSAPVMICLQGTNAGAHLSWGEARMPADPIKIANGHDFALQAVAEGYVAVCVEQSCFGERREMALAPASADPCIDAANHALLLGRTLIGERAADVSSVIDWLRSGSSGVDAERVYVMGNSAGGTTAIFAAALDPRIAGVLAGGCVGMIRDTLLRRRDGGGQNVVPGILDWLEFDDIIALLAPRPFLTVSGRADHIWPFAGAELAVSGASAVYQALGAGEAIAAVAAEGGHRFYPEYAWAGFRALLDRVRP